MNKMVSIIIPTYNVERYIDECLNSIYSQEFLDVEIIIVNDGSTDNTQKQLHEWEKKDERIKVINQKNQGVSSARNKGIETATGKYIMFLDSDDYLEKNSLNLIFDTIKQKKSDLICFGYNVCYENKKIEIVNNEIQNSNDCIESIVLGEGIKGFLWNKVFLRKIIRDNDLKFDKDIHFCEDLLFVIQYLKFCNDIVYINKALYGYRMRKSSVSFSFDNIKNISILESYKRILEVNTLEKYNAEFIYQYILYYYILKKLIIMNNICVDKKILNEEKRIMKEISIKKRIKLFINKYMPKVYLTILKIKNINKKYYE